jgi:hypothetical protein
MPRFAQPVLLRLTLGLFHQGTIRMDNHSPANDAPDAALATEPKSAAFRTLVLPLSLKAFRRSGLDRSLLASGRLHLILNLFLTAKEVRHAKL